MKSLTTSEEVYWLMALKIDSGQEARFKEFCVKLIDSTQNEAGCLNYEWSLSADGGTCHIYERYMDSAAVKIHRARNGELVKQLMTVAALLSFTLYGAPDKEVRDLMAARNAVVMKPLGGFGR